jgi:hypothetical protein
MADFKITWPTQLVSVWSSVHDDIEKFIATHWGGRDPSDYGVTVEKVVPTTQEEIQNGNSTSEAALQVSNNGNSLQEGGQGQELDPVEGGQ